MKLKLSANINPKYGQLKLPPIETLREFLLSTPFLIALGDSPDCHAIEITPITVEIEDDDQSQTVTP